MQNNGDADRASDIDQERERELSQTRTREWGAIRWSPVRPGIVISPRVVVCNENYARMTDTTDEVKRIGCDVETRSNSLPLRIVVGSSMISSHEHNAWSVAVCSTAHLMSRTLIWEHLSVLSKNKERAESINLLSMGTHGVYVYLSHVSIRLE